MGAGDIAETERANWQFHRAINLAANALRIRLTLATTLRFIPRGCYGLLPTWGTASVHGHDQILAALEQRDPPPRERDPAGSSPAALAGWAHPTT